MSKNTEELLDQAHNKEVPDQAQDKEVQKTPDSKGKRYSAKAFWLILILVATSLSCMLILPEISGLQNESSLEWHAANEVLEIALWNDGPRMDIKPDGLMTLARRALHLASESPAPRHEKVLSSLTHLACLYMYQGKNPEVIEHYKKVLEIVENNKGLTQYLYSKEGSSFLLQNFLKTNNYFDNVDLCKQLVRIHKNDFGPDSVGLIPLFCQLTNAYIGQEKWDMAEVYATKMLDIQEKNPTYVDFTISDTLRWLSLICKKLGKPNSAQLHSRRATRSESTTRRKHDSAKSLGHQLRNIANGLIFGDFRGQERATTSNQTR